MILEAVILIVGFYLFCCLGLYAQAVVKSFEFTGIWKFDVKDGYVGICKYPKWSLFWVEYILKRIRG
jgi:hypothetical protein